MSQQSKIEKAIPMLIMYKSNRIFNDKQKKIRKIKEITELK